MESGTLLHIALLKKTSKAKKRQKSFLKNKFAIHRQLSLNDPLEENFTISGWCTEEPELK